MKNIEQLCDELQKAVDTAYNEGVTISEAEKLAARTLSIRMDIAVALKSADIDARMKKHGVKATRADAYMQEVKKTDKKPAEGFLEHVVNQDKFVEAAEKMHAEADTSKDLLANYLDIFKDAHIYFRGIAKGNYE